MFLNTNNLFLSDWIYIPLNCIALLHSIMVHETLKNTKKQHRNYTKHTTQIWWKLSIWQIIGSSYVVRFIIICRLVCNSHLIWTQYSFDWFLSRMRTPSYPARLICICIWTPGSTVLLYYCCVTVQGTRHIISASNWVVSTKTNHIKFENLQFLSSDKTFFKSLY